MKQKEVLKATVGDLFERLAEVVKDDFIATYQREENALLMTIPNGQKFRVAVTELE